MGVHDYLRCDRRLENGMNLVGDHWQTKDGPGEMGLLVITKAGRLMVEEAHSEEIPEEDRTYYGKPEWRQASFYRLCGSIRRVVDRVVDANHHGEVRFYSVDDEYSAIFVNGVCVHLSKRSGDQP